MGRVAVSCLLSVLAMAVACCTGGSPAIPMLILREVDWTVRDGALMNAPERYIGRTVILGGAVLKTTYLRDKAVLEVLHLPLSKSTRPLPVLRESQGLFVAVVNANHAVVPLPPGAVVTIVGEVVRADRPGGSTTTGTAPRLHIKHVHVWESTLDAHDSVEASQAGFESLKLSVRPCLTGFRREQWTGLAGRELL
jgi:outer membrane lipoprotein